MKRFLKLMLCFAICLTGGIFLASCGKNNSDGGMSRSVDAQIREIYALAVDAGETRTYEEWLDSIKGENGQDGRDGRDGANGLTPYIGSNGNWFIGSTDTNVPARGTKGDKGDDGKDATYETYTVYFVYGAAVEFFDNNIASTTVKSTQWLTNLPIIKAEYEEAFLGWFIIGTNKQVEKYDFIGGNVELEARFDIEKLGFSGLYKNGKYVKTWQQLKAEYPDAFDGTSIVGRVNYNYLRNLFGDFVIDEEITSIGEFAFYGCQYLTGIVITDSVTSIGGDAFYRCTGLTSITIPNSVTSIGEDAFGACTGLTSITIPNSVTSIGEDAFSNCTGLTSITIPNSVTSIGGRAFSNCTGITSIAVDAGNEVYHSAGNCIIKTDIKELVVGCKTSVIPDDGSVTSIGDYAFRGCRGLTSITIPDSVTSIGEFAFGGCTGLMNITISDGVIYIDRDAFSNCTGLTSITIPNSVTSIGGRAFSNCTGITSIAVDAGNTVYHSAGNCIIKTSTKELVVGCKNSIIPNDGSVTHIGDYAFRGCLGLTSITIPNSVTSIGLSAFDFCRGLTSIIIPDSVTSIVDFAFFDCTCLTSVTIDSSTIANGLTSNTAQGYFINYVTTVYILESLETSSSTYLLENFTKQAESDKDGYDMWTRNA